MVSAKLQYRTGSITTIRRDELLMRLRPWLETHRFVNLLEDILKEANMLEPGEFLGDCDVRLEALGRSLSERASNGSLKSESSAGGALQWCPCF
jgi:hypothetical protein